jgi:predicted TIM-barrel fold metal-dependent hydrolase
MNAMSDLAFISVDDHVLEPPDLWTRYMPERFKDRAPRVETVRGLYEGGTNFRFRRTDDGKWASVWRYEDYEMTVNPGFAAAGFDQDEFGRDWQPMSYDEMRPGCFRLPERLADMDTVGVEASLNFPTFPRFCGQTFLEAGDRDVSLACVRAYNDWMIDEWCAGEGYGRMIPLTIVPLWDVELAADEIRRCADKGAHAMAFSEAPTRLKLPSIHSGYWDPMWAACAETDTVVNMHIGSGSTFALTSQDAPRAVILALTSQFSTHAFIDWMTSGVLERYGDLRIALSEGQIGWMPFALERLDKVWRNRPAYGNLDDKLTKAPSEYMAGRVFGCIYDDVAGLELRHRLGMSQIMFEVDYPHGDSSWPNSRRVFDDLVVEAKLTPDETYALARGNAITCYRLDRYGITE